MSTHIRYCTLGLLAMISLVGCKGRSAAGEKSGDTKAGAAEEARAAAAQRGEGGDPCSLLEQKEVEAVTGPLAGPPYRSREEKDDPEPAAGGDSCVYEMPDFRYIRMSVIWKDGAAMFKLIGTPARIFSNVNGKAETAETAKNAAKKLLTNGVEIAGEWDEASSVGCCMIYALRGDSMVRFDYRAWRSDAKGAANILNKALVRIDHPLSLDGNAGNEAAAKRLALHPAPRQACSLLSRAEVESVLGHLSADPQPTSQEGNEGCVYKFTQAESKESPVAEAPKEFKSLVGAITGGRTGMVGGPVEATMTVLWRGGYRQLSDNAMVSGAVMGNLQGVPGLPKRTEGSVPHGPWDEAAQTGLNFTAVKKDVAVVIDTEPMLSSDQIEVRRRLVAKAIEKIAPKQ